MQQAPQGRVPVQERGEGWGAEEAIVCALVREGARGARTVWGDPVHDGAGGWGAEEI